MQGQGESIDSYASAKSRLGDICLAHRHQDAMLIIQQGFCSGLDPHYVGHVQACLKMDPLSTIEDIVRYLRPVEAAKRQMAHAGYQHLSYQPAPTQPLPLHSVPTPPPMHRTVAPPPNPPLEVSNHKCYNCGNRDHLTSTLNPGTANLNADALSRAAPLSQTACSIVMLEDEWHQRLRSEQDIDEWCQSELAEKIAFRDPTSGLICKSVHVGPVSRRVVLLPQALVSEVVHHFHAGCTGGHWGEQMTFEILRRRFTWPKMHKDIKRIVLTCEPCTINKDRKNKRPGTLGTNTAADHFNQIVYVDLADPLPLAVGKKEYILVIVDGFTRWLELVALSSITSNVIIRTLRDQWILRYGTPEALLTDNGTQFTSAAFATFCQEHTIRHARITPYNPQANMAERVIRDLKQGLRILTDGKEKAWVEKLQQVAFAMKTKVNSSTGLSPAELIFGVPLRHPHDAPVQQITDPMTTLPLFITAAKNTEMVTKLAQKRNYDANRPESKVQAGDIVYVEEKPTTALAPRRSRAYRVIKPVGPRAFELQSVDLGKVIRRHVSLLKKGGVV